ncbi:MaoC family dehydratase [Haloechinothrix salitolerans]|uniref:MaoC family dehydratase n=1 Tax=Haloechinothrix salitolerans TaxID=926830 RepID=A0ABW2C755_9PSEU
MTVHQSSQGHYFEDFVAGDVYEHGVGRTVTTTDNLWFTLLTQNTARAHLDHHFASKTEFGKPLVNSTLTFAIINGQSVADISQNVIANLGWDAVTLPNPVFEGDTLYSESEILAVRESQSRPHAGIVHVRTRGYNQRGEDVLVYSRHVMVYRRGHAPSTHER